MQPFHLEWLHFIQTEVLTRIRALEMDCGESNEITGSEITDSNSDSDRSSLYG